MIDDIFSPDQRYKLVFSSYEVRMSHWIHQPHLIRVNDNQMLFSLNGDSWSAFNVNWIDGEMIEMRVSRYPGHVSCDLILNAETDYGSAVSKVDSFSGTLAQVSRWVLNL